MRTRVRSFCAWLSAFSETSSRLLIVLYSNAEQYMTICKDFWYDSQMRQHLVTFDIRDKYNILDGTYSSQVSLVSIYTSKCDKQTAYLELVFCFSSSWCSTMLCRSGGTRTSLLTLFTQLILALLVLFWPTSAKIWSKNIAVSHMFIQDFLRSTNICI